ncbi:MAG: thiosulfate sulfurtransferase [Actinomycetales bacterium]|nr:MAG: thiosulfate sulfurtransferase [Actinomycetales bacterium]
MSSLPSATSVRPRHSRLRRAAVVALAVVALAPAGCSTDTADAATPETAGTSGAAASAPANGAAVGVAGFEAASRLPGTVILDVRTPAEFAAGHLSDAVNIDVEAADFRARVGALDKSIPYAVYCRTGNRSATALAIMKQLGFTSTYHLAGGITSWTSAGRETVTG